jgi:hypothetical protein
MQGKMFVQIISHEREQPCIPANMPVIVRSIIASNTRTSKYSNANTNKQCRDEQVRRCEHIQAMFNTHKRQLTIISVPKIQQLLVTFTPQLSADDFTPDLKEMTQTARK